ncbi:LLM class flavin-dependent oxidoreductase [Celeribacter neptunius]|uniref:Luciferase-like monooxygenase n=1 Tax=Celeribacter neptunius TaxID=588602 RepID=A0A1I3S3C1_9RHOB|nr:LLM class flavin-dependent oxidoreductase [Celeribacter neptunius]SFJ53135.1 luciferase family oxidoreductase, group 1 [Celeribacter neptunius]
MKRYSLLDLAPVAEGHGVDEALANCVALAVAAEEARYHRYWVAEHHNMIGIASSATAVLIGQIAAATKTMRVGAGGIMLPNHAPLMVAEQFGTLSLMNNGRIDLGLGRAPGTDMLTARALRRNMQQGDTFPQDVQELISYLGDMPERAPVRAIPGMGTHVPVWILGSSLYGAQLAAHFGLPYAFASHFAPDMLGEALHVYRSTFQPSDALAEPYAVMAASVCAAESDEEATYLRSSQLQAFANIVTNNRGKLPKPSLENVTNMPSPVRSQVDRMLSCAAVGGRDTVHAQITALIERYQPDELMVTGMIHDQAARIRSFEIAAEVMTALI